MELSETQAFVSGCFKDEPASCACACPFGLDVRSFMKKMEKGRLPSAYRDLSAAALFPSIPALLCPQTCREKCQRLSLGDEALNIRELEKACVRLCEKEKAAAFNLPKKEKSIAIVGAGPAGLACALGLARKKYSVTLFDKRDGWGGHLRESASFEFFNADFTKQFSAETLDERYDTAVGSLDELSAFDAVYIATGRGGETFGLTGWNPELFTTDRPGIFLGGEAAGMGLMESVAAGSRLSQLIEAYLQTGRASLVVEKKANTACDGHMLPHPGEEKKPIVLPSDPDSGYTRDEAKAEASRCMQCVCDGCMKACEVMAHYKKTPAKLAADICGDSHTMPPFSNCEATRQTYSCMQCGVCRDVCEANVDMGALFRFSREDRYKQNKWVPGIHDYWLRDLDFRMTDGFFVSAGNGRSECGYVFFPGCQLVSSMPDETLAAYRFLDENLGCGVILGCCGAPAVWAGDTDRRISNTALLHDRLERLGSPKIVSACCSCSKYLSEALPEAHIVSLYELLDELGAPVSPSAFPEAHVFDPCAARDDEKCEKAVRSLAKKAGAALEELRDKNRCCGYGGHMRTANPELYSEITDNRAAEGEKTYIVYCANCLEVFSMKDKPCEHILSAVFPGGGYEKPSLDRKRENALSVKAQLAQAVGASVCPPDPEPWSGVKLNIPADVLSHMEDKLIAGDDLREAVYMAESEHDYFEDESGVRTACLAKKVMTYWVVYRPAGDGYDVLRAYCHRMHIGEESAHK